MVTFAAAAANRDQRWSIIVTIEGIGTADDGIWKFCSEVPTYASADAAYKPWLVEWPQVLEERVDPLGGLPEAGELSVVILDYEDALTAKLRIDDDADTAVEVACTAADSTIRVLSIAPFSADTIVFINNEALEVTGTLSLPPRIQVTRAQLGTDAQAHAARSQVFPHLPYLRSRRMTIYVAPIDGDDSTTEQELGTYYIDRRALTRELNAWRFDGKSQIKYLGRNVASHPAPRMKLNGTGVAPGGYFTPQGAISVALGQMQVWEDSFFCAVGDEILVARTLRASASMITWPFYVEERARAGTGRDDLKHGAQVRMVLCADMTPTPSQSGGISSFRYSPGTLEGGASPSTSRSSGTWTKSSQWVDISLCLLLSSAKSDDGLALTNSSTTHGNYSALPAGYGVGCPVAKLDMSTFRAVKQRTMGWQFPSFVVDATEPIGEVLTKNFLRPLGAFLVSVDGVVELHLHRLPMQGETVTTLDDDTILRVEIEPGDASRGIPPVSVGDLGEPEEDVSQLITSITYSVPGPDNSMWTETVDANDFGLYRQGGYYATDEGSIEIEVPALRSDTPMLPVWMRSVARARLQVHGRPQWRMKPATDISQHGVKPADFLAVTHSDLPSGYTGARAWSANMMRCLGRALSVEPAHVGFRFDIRGYGPGLKIGRVCPSAVVVGVSGNAATVRTNRYTHSDVVTGQGLEATDAAAFTVGDKCSLSAADGTPFSEVETISTISGDVITFLGNFSGRLAAGLVINYAIYASSTPTQIAKYVHLADETLQTIGAGSVQAWQYGQP